MASPAKIYQQEMHDATGFYATWLPGDTIEIGDAGILEGGRFRRMSSLLEIGIKFAVQEGKAFQNITYSSTKNTKVQTEAGAAAAVSGKAGISVEFSAEGAFLFQASRLQVQQLANPMEVGNGILKAQRDGVWDKSWLLVESLQTAERATILVSQDNSAGLVIQAEMEQGLPAVPLADSSVSLSIASSRGRILQLLGSEGLHPLYSCLRVKTPLLGEPRLQPVRGPANTGGPNLFSRPGIDDLLES